MKKIIFSIIMIICVFSINAQKIYSDIQNGEIRTIITTGESYSSLKGLFGGNFNISLSVKCTPNDTTYYLVPEIITGTSPKTIVPNAKMLLKVGDNIITTISPLGVGTTDYEYQIIGNTTYYYIYPIFIINKNDLELLANGECTKLRMQCTWGNGFFDLGLDNKKIKKFYLSKTINKLYNIIKDRLKKNNNLYENF